MAEQNVWDDSLFSCLDDMETCFCGCFCPPCLFGQNAEQIDQSNCCLWCCAYTCLLGCYLAWIPHYYKRQALREKYGIQEDDDCPDCVATFCCSACALCQEARVLKRRVMQSNVRPVTVIPQMVQPGRRY